MHVPAQFRPPGESWSVHLVRRNPLAQLTTNGTPEGGPFASHVPIILPPGPEPERLVGLELLGHMNRANPHWTVVAGGGTSLAVFTGPHSYVSPSLYGLAEAAPTWDFTAVHLRGTIRPLPQGRATKDVVTATVAAFESEFGDGWSMATSLDYFDRILPAVGAFRFAVESLETMLKLSQEQPASVRENVRESFAGDGCSNRNELASMMRQLPS
ncbi:FMN-binding negative transcriptional regulator [Pseudonocardia alni]|uniref:FMN-binding negative transcriptional regulator n=1 Tax=Pseudonocardia alni TaxID=33907 RepID=UPI0033FB5418